ncbi:MAG: hypothetical protein WCJ13_11965, partial [Coriobacteriia bacterium]
MFRRVHSSSLLIVSLVFAMLAVPAVAAAAELHVTKTAYPTALSAPGPVRYTYQVWYDGINSKEATGVTIYDDKLGWLYPTPGEGLGYDIPTRGTLTG